MNGLMKESK